jgi:pepF/M3 family oligoendopeptidase
VSTDSRNEAAQAASSLLAPSMTRLSQASAIFDAAVALIDLDALESDPVVQAHRYRLERAKARAHTLLSPEEESLLAELADSGPLAWSRLQGNLTSQIVVEFKGKKLPMAKQQTMGRDPDPDVRREAYHAEQAAWKANETALAAAMNSVKGHSVRVNARRGWPKPLDEAVFANAIDHEILDAMLAAAHESFPDFRRFFRAKARLLGHSGGLPWWDLYAPLGRFKSWPYDEGCAFVVRHFRTYSDKLADFAQMTFDKNWVDAEPRAGKRGGAYCTGLTPGVSRIFMNYEPSFLSVSTLAHELGHAYHGVCLRERTELQSALPMTLAETASIFCETLVKQAALAEAEGDERLALLDATLMGPTGVVVDITSRFLFEQEVCERRADRELSAAELCDAMRRAQLATYGDGLDSEWLHPYAWAGKPHYYARDFYNFPYMFGLLFGLGLYEVFRAEPVGFHDRYDALLADTGMASALELGQRFGIDLRETDFWRRSLATVRKDIDDFVSLAS